MSDGKRKGGWREHDGKTRDKGNVIDGKRKERPRDFTGKMRGRERGIGGKMNVEESWSSGLRRLAASIMLGESQIPGTYAAFLHVCAGYPEINEDAIPDDQISFQQI